MHGKKGITMMELVCVLALVGVVTMFGARMLTASSAQYVFVTNAQRAKVGVSVIEKELDALLRYAGGATLQDDAAAQRCLHSENGRIYNADADLFDDSVYGGLWYELAFEAPGTQGKSVLLRFQVWTGDPDAPRTEPVYESTWTVQLLNGKVAGTAAPYLVYAQGKGGAA